MKIVCFGSFNRDMVYGVDHIAAGGETVMSRSLNTYWGGKGLNQAVALARSCDSVYMAGFVGEQDRDILPYLEENNLHADFVSFSAQPTGHAIICVDKKGQNSITVFSGCNFSFDDRYVEETLSHFGAGDIVLLQNEINHLPFIIRAAHEKGMQVAINPSPFNEAILSLPLELINIFILNEIEGCQMTGRRDKEGILAALGQRFPGAELVLTLGKEGAVYKKGETLLSHGIYDVPVVDTTAAGDTFTGYFLASKARGLPAAQALELASKASSIAVSRKGATTSIPSLGEVLAFEG